MAAPPKKICLGKSVAGKKNHDVHQHFEPSGEPLRVRCKICYQKWFVQEVETLIESGITVEEAQKKVASLKPSAQV